MPPILFCLGLFLFAPAGQASVNGPGILQLENQRQVLATELSWLPCFEENWKIDEVFEAWKKGQFSRASVPSGFFDDKHTQIWFHIPSTLNLKGRWLVHSEQPGIETLRFIIGAPMGSGKPR